MAGPGHPLEPAHAQQGRGHGGPGVAGADHGRGPAVAHQLGRPDERGVLLAAHPLGRVLVHGDDLGAGDELEAEGVAHLVGRADQHHRDAPRRRPGGPRPRSRPGPGRRPWRRPPPAGGQRVGDGRGRPAQLSRPRRPGGPCTTRSSGRPRGAPWPGGSGGTRCGPAGSSTQLEAWRLRPLALDVFFLGTAIVGSPDPRRPGRAASGRRASGPGAVRRASLRRRSAVRGRPEHVEVSPPGVPRRHAGAGSSLRSTPHSGTGPGSPGAERGQGQLEQHGVVDQGLEVELVVDQRVGLLVVGVAVARSARRTARAPRRQLAADRHRAAPAHPRSTGPSPCR